MERCQPPISLNWSNRIIHTYSEAIRPRDLEAGKGFEPLISGLWGQRDGPLLYPAAKSNAYFVFLTKCETWKMVTSFSISPTVDRLWLFREPHIGRSTRRIYYPQSFFILTSSEDQEADGNLLRKYRLISQLATLSTRRYTYREALVPCDILSNWPSSKDLNFNHSHQREQVWHNRPSS